MTHVGQLRFLPYLHSEGPSVLCYSSEKRGVGRLALKAHGTDLAH